MKLTFKTKAFSFPMAPPFDGADYCIVTGWACPCGSLAVKGRDMHIAERDTYAAEAFCYGCGEPVGRMEAQASTIFGIEEDQAVLSGRWRVY